MKQDVILGSKLQGSDELIGDIIVGLEGVTEV